MRRSSNLVLLLAVALVAVWWILRAPAPSAVDVIDARAIKPLAVLPPPPATPLPPASLSSAPLASDPDRSHLLDELNQPSGTIQSDLRLLQELFAAWCTNFPRDGNPVGENTEITRSLTGANPLSLALVPKDHPAINATGELTDRWGTPFRFHQLSGTRMEIRSAGPDRRFGTADDAVLTP